MKGHDIIPLLFLAFVAGVILGGFLVVQAGNVGRAISGGLGG